MPQRIQQDLRDLYDLLLAEHTQALLEDRDAQTDVDDVPSGTEHLYSRVQDAAAADAELAVLDIARGSTQSADTIPTTTMPLLSTAAEAVRADKLATGTWTTRTADTAQRTLNRFLEHAGDRPWNAYTKSDVRAWRDSQSIKPASVNIGIATLGSILSWLIQQEDGPYTNPFEGMRLKAAGTEREAFTPDEVRHMLTSLSGWERDVVLVGAYTGMRVSEVCQLTPDDIVEIDGVRCFKLDSHKHTLKTDSSARVVPVHPALQDVQLPIGHKAKAVSHWFSTVAKKELNLPANKVLHSLRMAFATSMMQAGVSEDITAALLGHSVGNTLSYKLYASGHSTKQLQEAVALLKY